MLTALVAAMVFQTAPMAFEFREFTTTLTKDQAAASGALFQFGRRPPECTTVPLNGREVSVCALSQAFIDGGVAGREMRAGQAGFDADGTVMFRVHLQGADAEVVADAMAAKFGDPCEVEVAEWRNRMGAVLENPISTWCLSDGRLSVITRASQDPSLAEISFVADRVTQRPAPTVDF